MADSSTAPRRRYDNRARMQKAAQTRERIVAAGSELVHEFDSWDWRGLTFRAVAARAGVGERTVYRHFPTERHLHDAVMARLEAEAGVSYQDVDLDNLGAVTARVFASLQRFAVRESVPTPNDSAFVSSDQRRREALLRAVATARPDLAHAQRHTMAGLLDVLWSPASYERLVSGWGLGGEDATRAIEWLMSQVVRAIEHGDGTPCVTSVP
ncbi:TetR/AcrR family transcriptional regulator [Mycolicibacterium holsaticum]|uniref:TetR/AcrR family transcriptional regulator n=1 Tax=Mycolicibacterium holsaticum TaxID=152142 RepID=UPI001C7D41FB|nr:TetR/AcrR family transcriptional regulator [Mycolicibacterium holsaticum]MDA4109894.1 TetR family transcriptional regulator [Mycolicibacterium holsaticum DSM 44478 = JCM 12374]QZA10802.1 TetR/AcrR family transcriptional regulator [Mycolicibacterium holsaticum DSM 44478 = JCM 12374]UNC11699.1 TetR/AcrR family transcriptional regulator [Mycolicibacterium holsaticum DSM 44478 = JCM 12374]